MIQEILSNPSIGAQTAMLGVNAIGDNQYWMNPVYNFLTNRELPVDAKETSSTKRRVCSYVIIDDKLYRCRFSIPLLKCLDTSQAHEILQEIHEGINDQLLGECSLA